jgi:hypothetical protein
LCPRSQTAKASTTSLRHIQRGKRTKARSASSAVRSWPAPRTNALSRYADGQSASTAIALNPASLISARVMRARSTVNSCVPCEAAPISTQRASPTRSTSAS